MDYHKITLYVLPEKVDIVSSVLYDYNVVGVEVVDPSLSEDEMEAMFVNIYDLPLSKLEIDEIPVCFYLPIDHNIQEALAAIMIELNRLDEIEALGSLKVELDKSLEEDWAHTWKKFYKPFITDGHILIKPIWIKLEEASTILGADKVLGTDVVIDIDPGLAFGSGTHETTSMCITAIDKYMEKDDYIIDIGCGSGILGIAAAKLGAKGGTLIDLDEKACMIAKENLVSNQVDQVLNVVHGDLLEEVSIDADLIVSNIFADVIIHVVDDAKLLLKSKGYFICSGIIDNREADVIRKFKEIDFDIVEVLYKGEWVAIVARKR